MPEKIICRCKNELGTIDSIQMDGIEVTVIDPKGILILEGNIMVCKQCGQEFHHYFSAHRLRKLLELTGRLCTEQELSSP